MHDNQAAVRPQSTVDTEGLRPELARLCAELCKLRLEAGQPSLRTIASATGWSRATVGRVFSGALPKWDSLRSIVEHLGGDTDMFRRLWVDCMEPARTPTAAAASAATVAAADATTVAAQSESRRLPLYIGAAGLAMLLVVVSAQDVDPTAAQRNQTITDAAQFGLATVATILWAAVHHRRGNPTALALSLGLAGWSAGQACWLVLRDIFGIAIPDAPSIADWLYLLFPVFVIPGLLVGVPRKWRLIFAGQLGVLMLSTTITVILALIAAKRGPVAAALVYVLYAVTDSAVLALLCWRISRDKERASAVAAAVGVAFLLLADALFLYFAWWRPLDTIPYGADIGYMIFPVAMGVSAGYAYVKDM